MGGVQLGAAASGNNIFFCTDTARFFCVDAENGAPRWTYLFPTNTRFSSPPLVNGNRVWCFTRNGVILGFDEQGN